MKGLLNKSVWCLMFASYLAVILEVIATLEDWGAVFSSGLVGIVVAILASRLANGFYEVLGGEPLEALSAAEAGVPEGGRQFTFFLLFEIPAEEGLFRTLVLGGYLLLFPNLPVVAVFASCLVGVGLHYALSANYVSVNRTWQGVCGQVVINVAFCLAYLWGGGIVASLVAHYVFDGEFCIYQLASDRS